MRNGEDGSISIEFLLICVLAATVLSASAPIFEAKMREQRLAQVLDSYARALLIGRDLGKPLAYARAALDMANRHVSPDQVVRVAANCVEIPTCMQTGGALRLLAVMTDAQLDAVIEVPTQ